MNAYATLEALKGLSLLDIHGNADDDRLTVVLSAASRHIDDWCGRHFYTLNAAREFDGSGSATLFVPDLIEIEGGGLTTDDGSDGAFASRWRDTDYALYPLDADPTGGHDAAVPYLSVVALDGMRFPFGRRAVRIEGQWGYARRLARAGALVSDITDDQGTIFVGRGFLWQAGLTLMIGSEQMHLTGSFRDALSVERGVNGAASSAHRAGETVWVFRYPPPVVEATLLLAAILWRRGGGRHGSDGLDAGFHRLLSPYRKLVTGVGG